jgi:hypothetical protein
MSHGPTLVDTGTHGEDLRPRIVVVVLPISSEKEKEGLAMMTARDK